MPKECQHDGCCEPLLARGLCSKHYQRSVRGKNQHATDGQIKCAVCAMLFSPYRSRSITCSRACYRKLPDVVEKDKAHKRKPEIKETRNARRRISNNPEKRLTNRAQTLKRYGLTIEKFDQMLDQQNGVCAICGSPPATEGWQTVKQLHVDHDHATGHVRGLLCDTCNRGLGYFHDDLAKLEQAKQYLIRTRKPAT